MERRMKRICATLLVAMLVCAVAQADNNENEKYWSLQAGIGGLTYNDQSPDGQEFYLNENQGDVFFLNLDRFLTRRFALSAGVYFEREGLVTDLDSGIGLIKANRLGIQGGAKYYFFPTKWMFQPYVGASVQTNVLNLGTTKGSGIYDVSHVYNGQYASVDYDVQHPALALMPRLGVDIHIFSSLSLGLEFNMRYDLWGHNRCDVLFKDGPRIGQSTVLDTGKFATGGSISLKWDFPTKSVSKRDVSNLIFIVQSIIGSHAY